MKITRINVEFMLDEGTAVDEFLTRLTGRLIGLSTPVTIEHTPLPLGGATADTASATDAKPALENTAATTDTGSRRRRPTIPTATSGTATAPTSAAAPSETASAGSTDTGSRRRRAAPPPAAPDPMPINDAEMSKAASNTAEVLVNMGEDGPGIVMLVLKDFGVMSAGDVPQDQRQKFLDECAKEIMLAKKDHEMAP